MSSEDRGNRATRVRPRNRDAARAMLARAMAEEVLRLTGEAAQAREEPRT